MPADFPHHNTKTKVSTKEMFSVANLRRVDVIGAFLLLATSMLLVAALEEGGTQSDWKSPATLTPLILSIFLLIAFCFWERYLEFAKTLQEGVFPWRLATDRFCMGIML
jgi:hypothetical protein